MRRPVSFRIPVALVMVALSFKADGHEIVDFETEVLPILRQNCDGANCHMGQQTSGVELTSLETILASVGDLYGTPLVIPGNPDGSPLIDSIMNSPPAFGERMPPMKDPLSTGELNLIYRWINEGATAKKRFLRGDSNLDEVIDIADPVSILFYLFMAGEPPVCDSLMDTNVDQNIGVDDAIHLLLYLYQSGAMPQALTHEEVETCRDLDQKAGELSFTSIYEQIFARSCNFSACHSALGHKGDLVLTPREVAHASLVGIMSSNPVASSNSMLRVDPGKPDLSFLFKKLSELDPGEGIRMPSNSSTGLSQNRIQAIREWILAGAPLEGTIDGVPDLGEEDLPPPDKIPVPPVPENGMQIHLEPFAIGSGSEREIFYFVDRPFASLTEDPIIQRVDIHMSDDSHHFILYEWEGSSDPPAGVRNIGGILDLLGSRSFLIGSQQSFTSIAFPEGVGLRYSRDTSFDLNSHFLNLHGTETLFGEVYVNFFFAEPGSITTFVKPLFELNLNIRVPPYQTRTTTDYFPSRRSVPSGREYHIYTLSSHTHRHGVRFSAFLIRDGLDVNPQQMVYDNLDWDDPVTTIFDPPLVLTGGEGLRFETTHFYHDPPSPGAPDLTFGITSEDEMAILVGFYAEK